MTARNPDLALPVCAPKLFKEGEHVYTTSGAAEDVEEWVKEVATKSGQKVDWHYYGGRVCVLAIGDINKVGTALETQPLDEYGGVPKYYKAKDQVEKPKRSIRNLLRKLAPWGAK